MWGARQEDRKKKATTTGERLASAANEHLKKATEEHEGDRTQKIVTKGEEHDIRLARSDTVASFFLPTRTLQEKDDRRTRIVLLVLYCL